jgi:hypothetical protein
MTTIEIVPKFSVGDLVRKVGGTYQANGIIVGTAVTTRGELRYVFEFSAFPGMLHIFNEGQLEAREEYEATFPDHG